MTDRLNHVSDIPAITGECRRFANSTIGWAVAAAIHQKELSDDPQKHRWFTRHMLGGGSQTSEGIDVGERLGLWVKDPDKRYWRHCHMTWPFVMTALALRDEWQKRNIKELTQHDYDEHNWHRSAGKAAERGESRPQ